MKTYKDCTAGEALDAHRAGKNVEVLDTSFGFWRSSIGLMCWDMPNMKCRLVIDAPDPKLPKYIGWYWITEGAVEPVVCVRGKTALGVKALPWRYSSTVPGELHFDESEMDGMASRGLIVPPSVWMKDR